MIRRRLDALEDGRRTPAYEVGQLGRMAALAAAGLGFAVMPAGDAAASPQTVAAVRLTDPGLVHEVVLAHRDPNDLGPPAAALLRVLQDDEV